MNQETIGKFIKQLREEKGLTQEELANILKIGREAVSKWERGKTTPDVSILPLLSNFFEVSINEILLGEKNSKKDITLELYKDKKRLQGSLKKSLFIIVFTMTALALTFLTYYFANFYKTTHVYLLEGSSNNFQITSGIFVKTAERMYLNLGNILNENKLEIDRATLYYIENSEEKLIFTRNHLDIAIKDYVGYEEYFEVSKLDSIFNNLYLRIEYDNRQENIKLQVKEDYVNDKFYLQKLPHMMKERTIISKKEIPEKSKVLIENILKIFKKQGNEYNYIIENDNIKKEFRYIPESANLIVLTIIIDNKIVEKYSYFLDYEDLTFESYEENRLNYQIIYFDGKYRCDLGACKDPEAKKEKFWKEMNYLLET